MGQIMIVSSGFQPLPATPPPNWPLYAVWPGAVTPNGNRQATITDAEMLQLITWAAATRIPQGSPSAPITPTIADILFAWVGYLFNLTKLGIQGYFTGPPTAPPPINLN